MNTPTYHPTDALSLPDLTRLWYYVKACGNEECVPAPEELAKHVYALIRTARREGYDFALGKASESQETARALLEEVSQVFTREDDLPDGLLGRITKFLAPEPALSFRPNGEWYEGKIKETQDDDFVIGPAFQDTESLDMTKHTTDAEHKAIGEFATKKYKAQYLHEIDLGPLKALVNSPKKARAFLQKAGILGSNGKLAPEYGGEPIPEEGCEYCTHPLYCGTKCSSCGRETPQKDIGWWASECKRLAEEYVEEEVSYSLFVSRGVMAPDHEDAENLKLKLHNAIDMLANTQRDQQVTTPREGDKTLMTFYGVADLYGLIDAMDKHIEALQAKLPRNDQPMFTRVREG